MKFDEMNPAPPVTSTRFIRAPLSIVYSGLPSTSRWMRPSVLADQRQHEALDAEHARTAAPANSGPGKLLLTIQ